MRVFENMTRNEHIGGAMLCRHSRGIFSSESLLNRFNTCEAVFDCEVVLNIDAVHIAVSALKSRRRVVSSL